MQVHQHILFQARLAVVDAYAVIVSIEPMDKRLDGGFVEMAYVGGRLPRLVAHHERLRVYESEGVDDDFAFYGLDGVHDDGDGAGS